MPSRADLGVASGHVSVEPVPCFTDNYAYLVASAAEPGAAFVFDPSEAAPVGAELAARGLRLAAIIPIIFRGYAVQMILHTSVTRLLITKNAS